MTMRTKRTLLGLTALVVVLAMGPAPAQDPVRAGPADRITIDVQKDTPIAQLLDQVSEQTGRAIVYDPANARIKGAIGTRFVKTVPKERLFDAYRSMLSFYELTLVEIGPKGYEIYLAVDTRSTNNLVRNRAQFVDYRDLDRYADRDGLYIATLIPLHNVSNLVNLRQALGRVMSPAAIGHVMEVPGANAMVVMDFAPTVVAVSSIIAHVDVEAERSKLVMETIELTHVQAVELAETLTDLVGKPEAPTTQRRGTLVWSRSKPRVVAHGPRNALVVCAAKSDFEMIQAVVAKLDRPAKQRTAVESTGP
jgi:type II secretory pathway component GspD/PulD (secretin)